MFSGAKMVLHTTKHLPWHAVALAYALINCWF